MSGAELPIDPSIPPDDLLAVLRELDDALEAATVDGVLHAIVVAACAATGSSRGLAGLSDGEAVTSDAWYDTAAGWTSGRLRWPAGAGVPGRVSLSGTPLMCNDVPAGSRLCESDELAGLRRFACIPLPAAGAGTAGVLEVGGREDDYTAAEVRRLEALAAIAARRLRELAGDGGRLAELRAAQADIADRLQRRLLPPDPPALPGLEIAFASRSASTGVLSGGDFIDYYRRAASDSLAFAIGDVSGKGVDAMALAFVTKYLLRATVHQLPWPIDPGRALQELRNGLLEQPDFGDGSERFVTTLMGFVSPRHQLLQLASAGHPAPFVVRRSGVERPLLLTEPAIGVELGAALAPYPAESMTVERGDIVVLFTDGLSEVRGEDGGFFEQHLPAVLAGCHDRPAGEVVTTLLDAADRYASRPPHDDLAVLGLRVTRTDAKP